MPDFLIIGAMKSGTSSLYAAMSEHPQIVWARKKELHFFDGPRVSAGMAAYRTNFPLRRALRARHAITGEATARYMFEPVVLPAVRAAMPDIRLIISLRDPVERAVSHYFHERRAARAEMLPLRDALAAEAARTVAAECLLASGAAPTEVFRGAYTAGGLYAERLRAWLEVYPPEQLLVLVYEDLVHAPRDNLSTVWRFLRIDDVPIELPHRNVGTKEVVDEDIVGELAERFRQPNRDLVELLETVPVVRPPGPRAPSWAVDG